jgi:hypothetical protein
MSKIYYNFFLYQFIILKKTFFFFFSFYVFFILIIEYIASKTYFARNFYTILQRNTTLDKCIEKIYIIPPFIQFHSLYIQNTCFLNIALFVL